MDKLRLYQVAKNSIFYTDDVIYCSVTSKQIGAGYMVKIQNDEILGIFSKEIYFDPMFMAKLFASNEYIMVRLIISKAKPTKIQVKAERSKMTNGLRYDVLLKSGFKCAACGVGASERRLHVDHIIPVSKGGKTTIDNLQALCVECNSGKTNKL